MRYLELLTLSLLAPAVALATPSSSTPLWGRITDPADIRVFPATGNESAVINFHEWALEDDYLLFTNTLSTLRGARPLDFAQLYYRARNADLVLGSQELESALPLYTFFTGRGVRAGLTTGDWAASAFVGETQDLYASRQAPGESVLALTAGFAPSDYRAYGLAAMRYGSDPAGQALMAGLFQAGEDENSSYSVDLRAGIDLGAGGGGSGQAHRAEVLYSRPGLAFAAHSRKIGSKFGPSQGSVDLRGTHFADARLKLDLAPGLNLQHEYRTAEFGLDSSRYTRFSSWHHSLQYRQKEIQARLGLQTQSFRAGDVTSGLSSVYADANVGLGDWQVQPSFRSTSGDGVAYRDYGLGIVGPITDTVSLSLRGTVTDHNHLPQPITTLSAGLNFNLGQRGSLNVAYTRQEGVPEAFAVRRPKDAVTVSGVYRINGELSVRGNYSPYMSSLGIRYTPSENEQFQLEHRYQPVFGPGEPGHLGHTTTLSWSTSFGGPLESRLRSERRGGAVVRVNAKSPETGDTVPVKGVTLEVAGAEARTNERGEAHFAGLQPGTYPVAIRASEDNPNIVLPQAGVEAIEIKPGWNSEKEIEADAYSSIRIVAFNDHEETGVPNLGYVPLAGVEVVLDGQQSAKTGSDGMAWFPRLTPGRHKVELVAASAPKGMTRVPSETEFEVPAGETQMVPLPFRGKGKVRLRFVRQVAGAAQPVSDLLVRFGRRELGSTNAEGTIEGEIPAGTHELSFVGSGLAPFYVMDDPVLELGAGESVERTLRVAHYGLIAGKVQQKGKSLQGEHVQVRLWPENGEPLTCYTDEAGAFRFEALKVGRYRLEIVPETLPKGWSAPPAENLDVDSGEYLSLSLQLRAQPVR